MLCDKADVDAFYLAAAETAKTPVSAFVLESFTALAQSDPSPVVRLYLASAAQRLPFSDRWQILGELAKHGEDVEDNNLPRMYWFGLEPMVPKNAEKALALAVAGKIPKLQEFVVSHAPSFAQRAALVALRDGETFVSQSRERY